MRIAEYKNGIVTYRDMTPEEIENVEKPQVDFVKSQEPTQVDRIEAQVMYTALMTDTLLEV